jgi:transglutaminase superfamily protein
MAELDEQMLEYYAAPGPMTDLAAVPADIFDRLPTDPVGLCRAVRGLIVHEMWAHAYGFDVPEDRLTDLQARSAVEMTDVIRRLHPGPLSEARPVERRMVGNCRHFSTLSAALLRHAGIPARARCGFGMYFEPGKYVDHWVTEYWHAGERRWVRIDSQLDEVQRAAITADFDTEDLPPGPFVPAGEAWQQCRTGRADPNTFGIFEFWGLWFVQANVVRELAAQNKMELLPWDVWGLMTFQAEPDAAVSSLTDSVAGVVAGDDIDAVRRVYEDNEGLRVPDRVFDARFQVVHSLA